ncbi:hypothetical protein C7408_10446 [Paraburkholderia caballeronis]|uniref:Secreted protein n=2 Tax=Paraburkholderia caballeronis TaxID=416943 RepID=A0A1H7K3E1_9BURK|nr:hypothetical protein C7403_10348 [Paraburkholderia caballeronis]PXX02617.1 hypothetical protein C7407_10348 [Paraburkholderia caballeronis]RAK03342.1 hypothetical protein C7409_10348 [Paraburkholderia caballeronis]TDV11600.1 hypothetical protein C7406_12076 [Paraburkholderia caballeronis]TDV17393.1 hypothetical protein C7408_10446 [Paraburkholderia caballeronis]
MKSMKLLVCGVMVSLTAVAAFGQSPSPQTPSWHTNGPGRPLWPPAAGPHPQPGANEAAPRGDLRGDIASNARTRNAPPRQDNAPRRR